MNTFAKVNPKAQSLFRYPINAFRFSYVSVAFQLLQVRALCFYFSGSIKLLELR